MLRRLLIANRGEIACRIASTARSMGITSIAVYSEADRDARHVRVCDEAILLGPAQASESYLNISALLDCARRAGVDAIHPGYGFLSENADFAQRCAQAQITFVGPPASSIRAMGSKSAAKSAMAAAGVPVAPGYHGEDQSWQRLEAEALRVGFPLIVKASAGGGGKGMQVVESAEHLSQAIDSAQRLARTAFGDDRLLLERFFRAARHVEVQVFADHVGDVRTLFDRDCSVQRRHQKVIEEAPAPGLHAQVRTAMADAAVKVAHAVGYLGAGTIEFLVDASQAFYFMEMNTRLQVEHPVTELIAGVDLVEWQLRVARGETLAQFAKDLRPHGAAVEVRLYAEDPAHDYLPSTGKIVHLKWPEPTLHLRCDVGIDAGDSVSSFYDPMLGKLIAWGETRLEAIDRLGAALAQVQIVGVKTNRKLLASVLADSAFRNSTPATDFLELRKDSLLFGEPAPTDEDFAMLALWCATCVRVGVDDVSPWADTTGWRTNAPATSVWVLDQVTVSIETKTADRFVASVGTGALEMRLLGRDAQSLRLDLNNRILQCHVVTLDAHLHAFWQGRHVSVRQVMTEDAAQATSAAAHGSLVTPLPGTIVAVHVQTGDHVERGAALVTVEAMKMEHTLTAPTSGIVERIVYSISERVAEGAVLIELKSEPE